MNQGVPPAVSRPRVAIVISVIGIALFANFIAPVAFHHYEHNPSLARVPKRTVDRSGHLADPVNVAIVGTAAEVHQAFARAGWAQADSLDAGRWTLDARRWKTKLEVSVVHRSWLSEFVFQRPASSV